MNVLSTFSGIGALDLATDRAGMTTVGQVEIDPWCRTVLDRHWPEVPKHDDMRSAAAWWAAEPRPAVSVISGGPPCQPFTSSGHGLGADDPRNGWPWFLDLIASVRPRFVIAENADEMLSPRFHDVFSGVLSALADLGFAVEWDCVSACAVGAPHTRRRLCLVAYPDRRDGKAWMGLGGPRQGPLPPLDQRQSAWRDRVHRSVAASRADDRETDGSARRMVAAGGNAVVVDVFEDVARRVVALDQSLVA